MIISLLLVSVRLVRALARCVPAPPVEPSAHMWPLQEHVDGVMTIDNEALYGICKKTLKLSSPKCKLAPRASFVENSLRVERSGACFVTRGAIWVARDFVWHSSRSESSHFRGDGWHDVYAALPRPAEF